MQHVERSCELNREAVEHIVSEQRSNSQKRSVHVEQTLEVVARHLVEIMELEEGELEIGLETHFQDDLELESIEMIALGDALREHYKSRPQGGAIDFARWLTQLSIEQLMELKVGDLVEWLVEELGE